MLAPFLNGKAPRIGVRLADLDVRCWERFGEPTCRKLAMAVIEHLTPQIDDIVNRFGTCRIAPVGSNLNRSNLDLAVRTYNCLGSINIDEQAEGLAGITIRDVMGIRAFGITSLVDLLTAVEAVLGNTSSESGSDQASVRSGQNGFLPMGTCDVIRRSAFIPSSMADLHVPRPLRRVKQRTWDFEYGHSTH